MNCNCYEKLLYITRKQSVFIQRNAEEKEQIIKPKRTGLSSCSTSRHSGTHSFNIILASSVAGNTKCTLGIEIRGHALTPVKKFVVQRTGREKRSTTNSKWLSVTTEVNTRHSGKPQAGS